MKKIAHISASQITQYDRCPREWYYAKVLGLPTKQSAGATLGSKCHEELEEYLTTGVDNRSELTKSGDALLAHISKSAEIERALEIPLPSVDACKFIGFIDVYDLERGQIVDHKFKADLKKYGTTPEDLAQDVQAIAYARYFLQENIASQSVIFAHHQHQTKGKPKAERVEVLFQRKYIEEQWASVEKKAAQMAACGLQELEEVQGEKKSCWAFGGCSFMDVCKYSPRYKGENMGSLLDKAMSKKEVAVLPPDAPSREQEHTPEKAAISGVHSTQTEMPLESSTKPAKKSRAKTETPTKTDTNEGYQLFVDCFPTCGATDLAPIIKKCADGIAKAAGLQDLRLAEGNHALAYGKWKAALGIDVVVNLPSGNLYISRGDLHDAVLDVLCAGANFVVRPLR